MVEGLGFRVGLGFGVLGLGFRVLVALRMALGAVALSGARYDACGVSR